MLKKNIEKKILNNKSRILLIYYSIQFFNNHKELKSNTNIFYLEVKLSK